VNAQTLVELAGLKALPREGWRRVGVPHPESVAAHSWGLALLVLLYLPAELDRERALSFAALHDLAEVRVGDITPHDGVSREQKHALEAAAANELLAQAPALHELWHAYEAQDCAESRFVRQLDRLDMAVQAVAYRKHGTHEFLLSARQFIQDRRLKRVLDELELLMGEP